MVLKLAVQAVPLFLGKPPIPEVCGHDHEGDDGDDGPERELLKLIHG